MSYTNDELQIKTCNTVLDMYEVASKKGPREFYTKMAELNIRSQELSTRRYELDTELEVARLEYQEAKVRADAKIQTEKEKTKRVQILAEKEVRIAELETERMRIAEQSKCLQKLMDISKVELENKFNFYESMLKSCMEYFKSQIESLDKRIEVLQQEYNSNSKDLEARMTAHRDWKQMERTRNNINDKVAGIISNLTTASKLARLDFNNSVAAFLK